MRALVQRVTKAEVEVNGKVVGIIDHGLLVYYSVAGGDSSIQAAMLAEKVANLRVFQDTQGKMNISVRDARGGILAIPNFTLLADTGKGRRPAFSPAAPAAEAQPLFDDFFHGLSRFGLPVATGIFGADMLIRSVADGPINVVIDM